MLKQKLELTWIGKENRPKLEPRILLGDAALSYHAQRRVASTDSFDNQLIFGDNLLALKALEAEYSGKVKCVFIDPPYNTGSAFTHYDDGVEHSIWLSLMRDRLQIIQRLLSDDGSLWITIDDNEAHYLKVLGDEIFGRANFVANIVWQKAYGPRSNAHLISDSHDHILVFAKDKAKASFALLERSDVQTAKYRNPDSDPRGPWKPENSSISLLSGQRGKQFAKTGVSENIFEIVSPTGVRHLPPKNRCWAFSPRKYQELLAEGRIGFGPDGNARPSVKRFLSEVSSGVIAQTVWLHDEVGHNQDASREIRVLFPDDAFGTPKPEKLLHRIIHLATNPNDLVLDSFAGSGTTGAVAHKMGRRWIMIELGEHCHTHIIPRLKKVIDGDDQGGISEAVNWKGGGGFRYYRLAPSLLEKDKWGNWVINHDYNAAMLAEALCKLEGFTYAPSDAVYWQHGHSTERDFVYVTTASLTHEQLQQLADEVGTERSLLVLCSAFRVTGKNAADAYPNLTVKKIPKQVLSRCEWGHDDYSLQVENLPQASPSPPAPLPQGARGVMPGQQALFDGEAAP
ncbi:MAG: site-specific DNA-methyltransferase [Rhodocyclaceae bacterium]|nr:site-specific DNA-methyltransferase [Rhodocyclaceae bacterium]